MRIGRDGGSGRFGTKMDMTPLIDCIFQLILFLVLTTQITIQVEDVTLPFALEGLDPDKVKEEVPPVLVNVVLKKRDPSDTGPRRAEIVYAGERLGNDRRAVSARLRREVEQDAEPPPRGKGRGYEPGPGGRSLSKLALIIRADKDVPSEYIRTVFEACGDVGIYRVRVSSTVPQAGG
ncbi:MAG: ExbD/TolR family protein [Planctomycetota bacterium]